jgi:tetratricopeptide (TPR) repeat protein
MKNTTALWTLTLLVSLSAGASAAGVTNRSARSVELTPASHLQAPPQAAKTPQWKSRDEYDAFTAMTAEKDPNKKISLAEAFLQKYSNSDFKDSVYLVEMQTYQQLNQADKAVDAAQKALGANPDNLAALRFLSITFPFLYKGTDADATSKVSRADSDARHGLEVLQKLQKPAEAKQADFDLAVKDFRSVFNSAIGFAALQRKDYTGAITALKAATEDNPSSYYASYWMGLAYYYATPRDYDNAIWYNARAVDLAKAAKDPNADGWEKFLKQIYVAYHGTDTGLSDIVTQAASTPNPPAGFKVAQAKAPEKTGNAVVDAFNMLTFPLKLGGETAQKQWDGVKGQAIELGGAVTSVEKTDDPKVNLVRVAILDSTKSTDGYDIELKDSTQPNVKYLQKGDLVTFKGTADSYTATPNLILTLVGEVTSDLPDKPAAPKGKTKGKGTTRKTTSQ